MPSRPETQAQHRHIGAPLTARTAQVPKGRPGTGSAPFTWEESVIDTLKHDGLEQTTGWSAVAALMNIFTSCP